jgi:hypothetical protein
VVGVAGAEATTGGMAPDVSNVTQLSRGLLSSRAELALWSSDADVGAKVVVGLSGVEGCRVREERPVPRETLSGSLKAAAVILASSAGFDVPLNELVRVVAFTEVPIIPDAGAAEDAEDGDEAVLRSQGAVAPKLVGKLALGLNRCDPALQR